MQLIWFFTFGCLAANAFKVPENINGLKAPRLIPTHKVRFLLYNKLNPDQVHEIEPNYESIANSNFDPTGETEFFVHGWAQDDTTSMNPDSRDACFEQGIANFIFVYWEDAGQGYLYAKSMLPDVGRKLAVMFDHLVLEHKVPRSIITLVGHSLGAHIVGIAGKNVQSGKVVRMFGLDPAGPGFEVKRPESRFDREDAEYTIQITTNAHEFGIADQIADWAIVVNHGKVQPGCKRVDVLCNHRRSVDIFNESRNSLSFALVGCEDFEQALDGECGQVLSNRTLGGEDDYLLDDGGVYTLHTNGESPFATGTA